MAIKAGEVFWKISGDTKDIDKSLKSTETKMGKFAKAVKGAFIATAVIAFGKAVFDIGKKLVGVASDAEETRNKFNVVFADVAEAARASADEIADSYGLSQTASEKYLSGVGDIVTGLGATAEEALTTADSITRLAVDIDSFANLSGGAEQAVQALTSLFTGEREAAKALGIVINDTNLKAYAEGFGLVFSEMTPLEKGTLSLKLATEQSTLAVGDFARSQDSFANQLKIAKSNITDLSTSIGDELLPTATKAISKFNELIETIIEAREAAQLLKSEDELLEEAFEAFGSGTATAAQKLLVLEDNLAKAKAKSLQLIPAAIALTEAIAEQEEALRRMGRSTEDASKTDKLRLQELLNLNTANGQTIRTTESRIEAIKAEIAAQEESTGALEENNDVLKTAEELEEERLKRLAEEEERLKELARLNAEKLAANIAVLDSERERVAVIEQLQQEARDNQKARNEEEEQEEQDRHDARMQHLLDELDAASSYAGDAGTIFNNLIQLQMAGDEELTDSKKRGIIALYRLQQSANIAQIGINTATAVVRALADLGPIAGAIASGFIIGIGATQAAVVAATPPPVALADGGIVPARPGGTSAILGEAGQAEAVIPLDSTSLSGGGDTVLMIDGEILARWTQSQINNRAIVVPEGSMV